MMSSCGDVMSRCVGCDEQMCGGVMSRCVGCDEQVWGM